LAEEASTLRLLAEEARVRQLVLVTSADQNFEISSRNFLKTADTCSTLFAR
jgi:hypothetical protein